MRANKIFCTMLLLSSVIVASVPNDILSYENKTLVLLVFVANLIYQKE